MKKREKKKKKKNSEAITLTAAAYKFTLKCFPDDVPLLIVFTARVSVHEGGALEQNKLVQSVLD